jgi:uncharacterized membrane protein (UPF0127 family)
VPARSRVAATIAAVIAVASAVVIVVMVARWASDDGHASAPLGLRTTAAVAPFAGYRAVRAAVDGRCVRLVVADTPQRRSDGLRDVDDLGPYAGMLFAQRGDSDGGFTMAGLTRPLDIAWFAADGARVGATRMPPCPDKTEAQCPVYRSDRSYRFAVEVPAGARPPGSIASCG